jgi:magnesium-transporting ATPase (P-type)
LYLSGDKVQTAINISLSAGHFTKRTVQLTLVDMATGADCKERLQQHLQTATQSRENKRLFSGGTSYGSFNPAS